MAITKKQKEALVAQYKELLGESRAVFLASYGGMSVKDMQALRAQVREAQGAFHVTKNSLLKLALEEAGYPVPEEMLNGQTGAGFAMGEVPALAKTLVNFAKAEEDLEIKGGILSQEFLTRQQVEALAELPSLDQLRAQIVGLISAPAQNLASVVASGVRQVINVIDAYARSEDAEPEAA